MTTSQPTDRARVEGYLCDFCETGTEGVLWMIEDDLGLGIQSLHAIHDGDHLTIKSRDGRRTLWAGTIREDRETGRRPRPFNPIYLQPTAKGYWVHWTQKGFTPDKWASFFLREENKRLRGILKRRPTIYFDLDGTLHHLQGKRSAGRVRIELRGQVAWSCKRPLADAMLAWARARGPVQMLTAAARDYALAHNARLQLGFAENDIVAREDFLWPGCDYPTPKRRETDPSAILIDDTPPSEWGEGELVRAKMAYLGIDHGRMITVRRFAGADPKCFAREWATLKRLISGPQTNRSSPSTGKM